MEWNEKQDIFVSELMNKYKFPEFITEANGKIFDKLMVGNNCLYLCFKDNTCWYIPTGYSNHLSLEEEPCLTFFIQDLRLFSVEASAEFHQYCSKQLKEEKADREHNLYLMLKEKYETK